MALGDSVGAYRALVEGKMECIRLGPVCWPLE